MPRRTRLTVALALALALALPVPVRAERNHVLVGTDNLTVVLEGHHFAASGVGTTPPAGVDHLSFAPDGSLAFLSSFATGQISALDVSAGSAPVTLAMNQSNPRIAADPDGRRLWAVVANRLEEIVASNTDSRWRSQESWWSTVRFADLDDDGDVDVCARRDTGYACALNDGDGYFSGERVWEADLRDANGWAQPQYYRTIQLADVDGDGYPDLCARGTAGVQCSLNRPGPFGQRMLVLYPGRAGSFSDVNGWQAERFYRTIRVVDVTGDGLADVCGRGDRGLMCQYSRSSDAIGTRFLPVLRRTHMFGDDMYWGTAERYWGTVQPVDVDVTAGAEWCGRGSRGVWCSNR